MAVKFLDGIIAEGARPVTITGGAIGTVAIKGSVGGWATGYFFTGSSGTFRGGFGALGNVNDISYYFIGDAYNDTTMVIQPNAGNVGIGTTAPGYKLTVAGTIVSTAASNPTLILQDTTHSNITIKGDSGIFSVTNQGVGQNITMLYSGNVGVGLTSPSAKLHISSNINGDYGSSQMRISGSSNAGNYAYVKMTDYTANTAKLTLGTTYGYNVNRDALTIFNRNVGIGATLPTVPLDILDTLNQTAIRVTNNQYNNYLIQKRRTDNSQILGIQEFGSNGGLSLVTGGSQRLNVNNLGNVGIGTTSPVGKLEVAGNFRLRATGTNNDSYPIHFTNTSVAMARDDNNLELHAYNAIVFGASTTSYPTSTERMRILNNGNVGIGTTAPNDGDLLIGAPKLHVAVAGEPGTFNLAARFQSTTSDSNNTGTAILINSSNDRGLLIKAGRKDSDREVAYFDLVSSSGGLTNMLTMGKFGSVFNVGIGTTSPNSLLQVGNVLSSNKLTIGGYYGTGGGHLAYRSGHTGNSNVWDTAIISATDDGNYNGRIEFKTTTSGGSGSGVPNTKMVIKATGNVGIGTTAPSEKLQVNGTVRATSYKSSDGSAGITSTFTVRNGNNSASLTFVIKNGIVTSVTSDRRLKENITLVGTSDSGINIYTYEYKYKFSLAGVGLFQGVMSDEVPAEAVSVDEHGYDMVDYSLIDVEFKRLSN
tara:strand:- start:121 stop:2232 length:2112 start_codon:yes stop_codon:yes gene_type:complete